MKYRVFIFSLMLLSGLYISSDSFAVRDNFPTQPEQKNAALSIAHACGALIESIARNPAVDDQLIMIYDDHVRDVMSMNLPNQHPDVAEAKGIISKSYILAFARNPSLQQQFKAVENMCVADINAL